MSSIGKNIKKIRGVKGLNQSDFADIFDLKRASIGAYEEGRAEPKLATIMEIANYFSITVDDLLKKELSVNDLYHFDIFRKDLIKGAKHNLRPSKLPPVLSTIPFISQAVKQDYLGDREALSQMAQLSLPLDRNKNYCAFELADNSMLEQGQGIGAGDIVIAHPAVETSLAKVERSKVYLFETAEDWVLRSLEAVTADRVLLKAWSSSFYEEELLLSDIVALWQVERVLTKNISSTAFLQTQIDKLREEVSTLLKKA